MFGAISRRMAAKVFLAIGLVVGAALLLQAWTSARSAARQLETESQSSAERLARLIVGGIEHTMLEGDGIKVKRLVAELKQRVGGARVRIYDPEGVEVFAPEAPPPQQVPAGLREAMTEVRERKTPDGSVVRPVESGSDCQECHAKEDEAARFPKVRGALRYRIDVEACADRGQAITASLVEQGFVHVMTAQQTGRLNDYFGELEKGAEGIDAIGVFDTEADLYFGRSPDGLSKEQVQRALEAKQKQRLERDGGVLQVIPLPMTDRCVECHDDDLGSLRGLLVVSLHSPAGGSPCPVEQIEHAIITSLRTIMLSALGRRIADFLAGTAATGIVEEMSLFDNDGRVFWSTSPPPPPPQVARALATSEAVTEFRRGGGDERVLVVEPLENKPGCRRCHGSGDELRGVVSVSLSNAEAARQRERQMRNSVWFTGSTLAGMLIILLAVLQYLIARPVNDIGNVADEVGKGNLDVEVERANPDGDEIGRLGERINEMVRGLRAKTHLEKFVSRGTAAAAHGADAKGLSRSGVVRSVTVLFSDIRGFTSFSEEREPQEVVDMLNRLLNAQAEVVYSFGGDIDKFVGDELMVVFDGDDAAVRAVRCATRMIEAVGEVSVSGLQVGIGVHRGEVVYGAIGHEDRMDFTVIGDVVNTGARLCSAAKPGQILVSAEVKETCEQAGDIDFEQVETLPLKGKKRALKIFEVDC